MVGGTGNYATIQQGIQAAENAGVTTVYVNAGTYTENDAIGAAGNGLTITTGGSVTLVGGIGITNAVDVTISGITFQGNGSNTAITAVNSSGLTITDNSFLTTGEGVFLNGTIDSTVSNNRMITTTMSAIEEANGANGNTIDSNLIDGVTAPDTIGAIWAHGALNGTITHNQITNTTGAAISLSDFYGPGTTATENDGTTVAYNSLDTVDTQSQDSGAIYVLGRSQDQHTNIVITNNYVGATGSLGAQANGIYLDDNSSGVAVTRNIVRGSAGLSAGFQIHGGSNNTITGNIFDLGPGQSNTLPVYGLFQAVTIDQAPQGGFPPLHNDVVTGNIFTSESSTPRDPAFGDLTNGTGNVSVTGNDYWAFSGAQQYVAGSGAGGDTAPHYVQPSAQQPSSLAGYTSWSGDGINFISIDTSAIGLAPHGAHAY